MLVAYSFNKNRRKLRWLVLVHIKQLYAKCFVFHISSMTITYGSRQSFMEMRNKLPNKDWDMIIQETWHWMRWYLRAVNSSQGFAKLVIGSWAGGNITSIGTVGDACKEQFEMHFLDRNIPFQSEFVVWVFRVRAPNRRGETPLTEPLTKIAYVPLWWSFMYQYFKNGQFQSNSWSLDGSYACLIDIAQPQWQIVSLLLCRLLYHKHPQRDYMWWL